MLYLMHAGTCVVTVSHVGCFVAASTAKALTHLQSRSYPQAPLVLDHWSASAQGTPEGYLVHAGAYVACHEPFQLCLPACSKAESFCIALNNGFQTRNPHKSHISSFREPAHQIVGVFMYTAYLMHAGAYVACREPFQLLAGLQQQAAPGNGHRHSPAVPKPHEEAREARLAVDGQEVEVVVVARYAGAGLAMHLQVAA